MADKAKLKVDPGQRRVLYGLVGHARLEGWSVAKNGVLVRSGDSICRLGSLEPSWHGRRKVDLTVAFYDTAEMAVRVGTEEEREKLMAFFDILREQEAELSQSFSSEHRE